MRTKTKNKQQTNHSNGDIKPHQARTLCNSSSYAPVLPRQCFSWQEWRKEGAVPNLQWHYASWKELSELIQPFPFPSATYLPTSQCLLTNILTFSNSNMTQTSLILPRVLCQTGELGGGRRGWKTGQKGRHKAKGHQAKRSCYAQNQSSHSALCICL